jgi:hypothetical protein
MRNKTRQSGDRDSSRQERVTTYSYCVRSLCFGVLFKHEETKINLIQDALLNGSSR